MTRQVQIGLSHSEKAKKLSYNGFYEEALKELNIALRAFESENKRGEWDDAIAGVLNNAGFVYLFLGNYQSSEDTFKSALTIKGRLGDQRSLAATLAGMSDACKGLCLFEESAAYLEESLDIALALKDQDLAKKLLASMDTLERTRCDMPDPGCKPVDFDELYVPPEAADITAKIADVSVYTTTNNEISVEMDIGFPYLMKDLREVVKSSSRPFPCIALLLPPGVESHLARLVVTDEEELSVGSFASSFDGIIYGPGSYNRGGPVPMPEGKQFIYTFGCGHVLGWDITANGWYHVEATIEIKSPIDKISLAIALPFGTVRAASISVNTAGPDKWSALKVSGGSFIMSHKLETAKSALSGEKVMYSGRPEDIPALNRSVSLKYGILNFELSR
jgi:tetratricopeptide (TPR) repeat protein